MKMTPNQPCLLSATGSNRATAYNWGNKSVTLGGQTHAVWLDRIAAVCGATFDHAAGEWGPVHRLFEGCDNHCNPSITADRERRLRLVWGPHGFYGEWNQGRVKWARAAEANRIDRWDEPASFGYGATAAGIMHGVQGLDMIACRGGEHPPSTMFHRQREQGGFTSARELMHQEIAPQYTHHYGHIACGPDGAVYVACHFYNVGGGDNQPVTGDKSRMRSYGMAVLKSPDLGRSWTNLAGRPVAVPAVYGHAIAIPPLDADMYVVGLVADHEGALWALTCSPRATDRRLLLSRWAGGEWASTPLEDHLPADVTAVDASLTVDTRGRVHVAATALPPAAVGEGQGAFGHPASEVYHLLSADRGVTWGCERVSVPSEVANWLPTLSRCGPCQPVDRPLLLYTHGEAGGGLHSEVATEVMAVLLDL